MRKNLIAVVVVVAAAAAAAGAAARGELPAGAGPAALEFGHFPTRMHAVVWRNWNLVETARLARVLETSAENVRAVAASMGLPGEVAVPAEYRGRLYLSVIRRNWHLLPYEQLLTLLDVTEEQLGQTLREDDFLYIKLGSLKPKCARVVYAPPDAAVTARCAEIAKVMAADFPAPAERGEAPLGFLKSLGESIADGAVRPARGDGRHPRYLYSYFAVFGDPLSDPALDPYPDGLLQRYADLGVNGVWLHVVLRDLAPSADFPEFGAGHERRLANLAKLVARAKRFGIGVYLYINEPRAMPAEFYEAAGRGEMAGVVEGGHTAMCTSNATVRRWLAGATAHVFKAVPDLAGVFTITASENLTSCASHGHSKACPRCKDRKPGEIIAEVNATIERAVHEAAPGAKFIAWDWGWGDEMAAGVIGGLPKSAYLMSVSEWSLPLNRGGVRTAVGEYSISAPGPGPRATRHWGLAREAGLKTLAKVQANVTWELSAVPYLPTYDLIAEHAGKLASADVDGRMLSWSLGGYPSANLEIFQRLSAKEQATGVLDDLARRQFGAAGAGHARKAWGLFSEGFREFPYDGGVVYTAPQQFGPANLLFATATGYRATMIGFPYDDLKAWCGPYPAEVFVGQMEKLTRAWAAGLIELESAARGAPAEKAEGAEREVGLARAALVHFTSTMNQAKFVRARDALGRAGVGEEERMRLKAELRRLLEAEIADAKTLEALQRRDSRIGFEASNHYYYVSQDLREKVLNCRWLVGEMGL